MKTISIKHISLLLFMLLCFIGQSVATTLSCKNMFSVQNNQMMSTMVDCHEKMALTSSAKVTNAEQDEQTEHCEEKCTCCAQVCASTSLFLASVTFSKPVDSLIPFFEDNLYSLNTHQLYRPPIAE